MSRFFIINQSCYRRKEEVAQVRRFLQANDWTETTLQDEAEVVLYFACAGLRHLVDEKIAGIQATLRSLKPGTELIIGSCLPGMAAERLRQVFTGKTLSPTDCSALNALPGIRQPMEAMPSIWGRDAVCQAFQQPGLAASLRLKAEDATQEALRRLLPHWPRPFLKRAVVRLKRHGTVAFSVAAGCSGKCTYCAKPFASGQVRSKPVDLVVDSIARGVAMGYRGFDLYADSIGAYGADLGANLGQLLERLLAMKERFSIGLFDVRPVDFMEYFSSIHRLAQAGRLHYLYVAVQSGSERILKRMNRPCKVEELIPRLEAIRRFPEVFMQTGIIAGFPGETDEEFEATLRLLQRVAFDNVYVHYYCDMPNTPSSRLPDKVDRAAMERRLLRVNQSAIHHDQAATQHEWDSNLAFHA